MKASDEQSSGGNRFELLVQSVTDYAIYMLSPDGIVSSWNAGAERFKGYAAAEIIGEHFSRFYTDEDRNAAVPHRALETARTEGRFEAEGWRVRKDGTHFWANVVIDPIRDPKGQLVGFAKITRDLTERRAAEEQLRRSEERFRLLIQSVSDYAIYMLDQDGTVSSWNPGAERFKGYSEPEIIGEHFSRFYTDEDRAAGMPQLALATARSEGRFKAEGWRVRKDGSHFWASVVIDPVRNEAGELIGFAKITRDLTERRNTQQELEETRERYFQSQKLEAIGKLTGGVAHDFNNLLSVILGSLHLAQRRLAEGADVSKLIANSMKAAERGASLTQRMLAFARKQELQIESVDLPALVDGMADLLQHTLGAQIRIETEFAPNLQLVQADSRQLELALMNLIVNARDAMPSGGVVGIAAVEADVPAGGALAAGRYVKLSVTDSGEGMDADTLARSTEPFFTTKGIGKGTGLGLPMVHGLAEQSGGQLILRSSPKQGTTAELWLPLSDAASAAEVRMGAARSSRPSGALRILTVDDDMLVLANTAAMLEELGHDVIEASSGHEALGILDQERVDLIVTDYAMPGMTGAELVQVAREHHPGLPVLMVSGYADLPGGARPNVPRLAKPFGEAALIAAISRAMSDSISIQ